MSLSFWEKISIDLHPFRNPNSPFVYEFFSRNFQKNLIENYDLHIVYFLSFCVLNGIFIHRIEMGIFLVLTFLLFKRLERVIASRPVTLFEQRNQQQNSANGGNFLRKSAECRCFFTKCPVTPLSLDKTPVSTAFFQRVTGRSPLVANEVTLV